MIALASLDISTGEFEVGEVPAGDFPGEIVRLSPGEVIAADRLLADADVAKWMAIAGAAATPVPAASFDSLAGERLLKAQLGVADLAAFGAFSRARAGGRRRAPQVRRADPARQAALPAPAAPDRAGQPPRHRCADAARAWSCCARTSGERKASLLAAIDRTVTGPGARELAARLASPLRDPARDRSPARRGRLPARADEPLREDARASLRTAPDIARAMSRLALQRGGPRDLAAVRDGLRRGGRVRRLLRTAGGGIGLPDGLGRIADSARGAAAPTCRRLLARALVDEPPHLRRDGGFVRAGYRADLDEARALARRQPQGDGRARGPLRRGDRHQVAQGPPQQHPGLLRRGAGQRRQAAAERSPRRRPSATARPWPARCASPPRS